VVWPGGEVEVEGEKRGEGFFLVLLLSIRFDVEREPSLFFSKVIFLLYLSLALSPSAFFA